MDYVFFWNSIALELNRLDHTGKLEAMNNRGPTRSSRALAIAHLAMHDSYFGRLNAPNYASPYPGLSGKIATYLDVSGLNPVPFDLQTEGPAVSGSASTVLKALYPSFHYIVDDALSAFDFGMNNPGFEFGVKVANLHIENRKDDGSNNGGSVSPLIAYWRHREDPTNIGQGLFGQLWGQVRLFSAIKIPNLDPHPEVRSRAYDADLDLVREKGNVKSVQTGTLNSVLQSPKIENTHFSNGQIHSPRSPYETLIGLYWAYDGASQIGTPPRLYNQVIRQVLAARINGSFRSAASARLFALINVAMADAGIAAWFYKYVYQLWRPILGIREYDSAFWNQRDCVSFDLNPRCDPYWTPLGAPRTNEPGQKSFTPPFPAYPSGHATFGAAAFDITRLFFGFGPDKLDTLNFTLVSDEMNGRSINEDGSYRSLNRRSYPSLIHAMFDNSISRVFLGVHWRFDGLPEDVRTPIDIINNKTNIGGVPLGRAVAQSIFSVKMKVSSAQPAVITPANPTRIIPCP